MAMTTMMERHSDTSLFKPETRRDARGRGFSAGSSVSDWTCSQSCGSMNSWPRLTQDNRVFSIQRQRFTKQQRHPPTRRFSSQDALLYLRLDIRSKCIVAAASHNWPVTAHVTYCDDLLSVDCFRFLEGVDIGIRLFGLVVLVIRACIWCLNGSDGFLYSSFPGAAKCIRKSQLPNITPVSPSPTFHL